MLTQAPGSIAKQKDFLYMISRGTGFDQMLMESLINSYVVITMIIVGFFNVWERAMLAKICYCV